MYTTRVNLNNIVMWEILHNSASWDCFRTLTLPDTLRNSVHIWKSHVCANKLDVQEPNVSLTQVYSTRNNFTGCWSTHGRISHSWSLGFGHWSVPFFPNKLKKSKGRIQANLLRNTPSNMHTHNQTKTPTQHENLELCNVEYVSSNVKSSQFGAMLYIFER